MVPLWLLVKGFETVSVKKGRAKSSSSAGLGASAAGSLLLWYKAAIDDE